MRKVKSLAKSLGSGAVLAATLLLVGNVASAATSTNMNVATFAEVPEPNSLGLLIFGLALLGFGVWKRKRNQI